MQNEKLGDASKNWAHTRDQKEKFSIRFEWNEFLCINLIQFLSPASFHGRLNK